MKQGTLPVMIGVGLVGGFAGILASMGPLAPQDCGFLSTPKTAEGIAKCRLSFWGLAIGGTVLGSAIGWLVTERM